MERADGHRSDRPRLSDDGKHVVYRGVKHRLQEGPPIPPPRRYEPVVRVEPDRRYRTRKALVAAEQWALDQETKRLKQGKGGALTRKQRLEREESFRDIDSELLSFLQGRR